MKGANFKPLRRTESGQESSNSLNSQPELTLSNAQSSHKFSAPMKFLPSAEKVKLTRSEMLENMTKSDGSKR